MSCTAKEDDFPSAPDCAQCLYQLESAGLAPAGTAAKPVKTVAPVIVGLDRIEPRDFDWVMRKFREFCHKEDLIEAPTQSTVDILSACEDTQNLGTFQFIDGLDYPLKQTGQMVLEHELLRNPKLKGLFCQTTSYRFEKHPVPGRHDLVFQMGEYEIHGPLEALVACHRKLLEHMGFGPAQSFPQGTYADMCKRYNVSELTHDHETQICKDFGPIFFLTDFPETTSPFWNMKRDEKTGTARKCDVLMYGMETIGSAERSCDVATMRERFYSIMDGKYAEALFRRFGKERVQKELEEFFKHKFICRSGAGIGITRLIKAANAAKLIPKDVK